MSGWSRRVVEQGWSLSKAAAAAEVERADLFKWVARYRAEGPAGLLDRSSAPGWSPTAPRSNGPGDRCAAQVAVHRTGDRRAARPAAIDGLGDPDPDRDGQARAPGLEPAERYERAAAGELIHIDVKKLGRIHGGAGKRITGIKRNPGRYRRDVTSANARRSAGTTSTSPSTTRLAWPTPRCSPTRKPAPRSASCGARSRSSPATA